MIQHQITQMTLHQIAHMSLSLSCDDETPPEEVLSNIIIFEEESDEDYQIFIDDGQISDHESSENEDQEETSAGIATYYANPFQSRLRRRNILTQPARKDATPDCKIDTFKLFYRPVTIFFMVRETNRKAKNVGHQHGLLPNFIYKDFPVEEVGSCYSYHNSSRLR